MRVLRSRVAWILAGFVPLVVCPAGCDGNADGKAPVPVRAEPRPPEITVAEVRAEKIDAAVTGYKGKVVVVDFWATWCGPCVKKFPHLVDLHRKYADKGLASISVSMDKWEHAEDYEKENGNEKVLAFLKEKKAAFPNFIAADPDGELPKFAARFGEFAGIPHMAIFDKSGRRVWDSTSGMKLSDDQLDKLIAAELAK